ncbi:MAG: hypothetical protein GDA68_08655 [Nitrospira sp. CR2.1]|nr:hypothetical protein [Nitrospira sp. CR2.1]MBA5876079.1 hypothetical protein [Nitrospira sp. CR1.2]
MAENLSTIANGAYAALLVLGLITLRRVCKRNMTTDSYKDGMDHIRNYFAMSDQRLARYHPFKASNAPRSFWERHRFLNGGLLTITCSLNSAFIAVLCMMNANTIHIPLWLAGAMGYAASLVVQWVAVESEKKSPVSIA